MLAEIEVEAAAVAVEAYLADAGLRRGRAERMQLQIKERVEAISLARCAEWAEGKGKRE